MARNLRDKIRLLVNDAYDLRKESVITMIENLVKEELKLQEEEKVFTYFDLNEIAAAAAKELTSRRLDAGAVGRIAGDAPLLQVLCIASATIAFLRNRGYMAALLKYQK